MIGPSNGVSGNKHLPRAYPRVYPVDRHSGIESEWIVNTPVVFAVSVVLPTREYYVLSACHSIRITSGTKLQDHSVTCKLQKFQMCTAFSMSSLTCVIAELAGFMPFDEAAITSACLSIL